MTATTLVTLARWAVIPLALVWLAIVAEYVRYARAHRPRPFDWERDCPELRDTTYPRRHVHVVSTLRRWQ